MKQDSKRQVGYINYCGSEQNGLEERYWGGQGWNQAVAPV
jgi:hypothetical protein